MKAEAWINEGEDYIAVNRLLEATARIRIMWPGCVVTTLAGGNITLTGKIAKEFIERWKDYMVESGSGREEKENAHT